VASRAGSGSGSRLGSGGRFAAVLVAASFLGACALFPGSWPENGCAPDFPLKDGWLGGDGVSSVDLGEGRSLWFFGDTFIGAPHAADRLNADLIANSVGRSRCADGVPEIAYRWRKTAEGPRPIFEAPGPGLRVWPLGATLLGDRLLVGLLRVRTVDPENPLGFRFEGMDLARIANWRDAADRWRIDTVPLTRDPDLIPGAALLVDDGHLVLAAPWQPPSGERVLLLARLPRADALGAEAPRLEFWTGPQTGWEGGTGPEDAMAVVGAVPAEMSLFGRSAGYRLVAGAAALGGRQIVLRAAPDVTGPWSPAHVAAETPATAPDVFCYAGKAHPQFRRADGRVLASYACNSFDSGVVLRDLSLYRPKTLWIDSDPRKGEANASSK
jgi:hypothetical protein